MKKLFILLGTLFLLSVGAYAQKGKQAIGFGLGYGTEIESIGLGIKYQYNITNPIRIEPSLNYFFENDNVSMLDVNVNFHYLCPVASNVKLYPLFGLTLSNWMFDMYDVDWDGKDEAGKIVNAGKYIIHIETSREHGDHSYQTIELNVTPKAATQTLPAQAEIGTVKLNFQRGA
jgi:hypothetical protein